MKVLMLDDDLLQIEYAQYLLKNLVNVEFLGFVTASDCLSEIASLSVPYTLILDVVMPRESAVSFLPKIENNNNLVSLILLSSLKQNMLDCIANFARETGISSVHSFTKSIKAYNELPDLLAIISLNAINSNPKVISIENTSDISNELPKLLDESSISLLLLNDEFIPFFQPIINIDKSGVVGVNLDGRLHIDNQLYSSESFFKFVVSIYKETAYIIKLLKKTFFYLEKYNLMHLTVSFRVTRQSLGDASFSKKIISLLNRYNFHAAQMIIEITEFDYVDRISIANLLELKLHKVTISVDNLALLSLPSNNSILAIFSQVYVDLYKMGKTLSNNRIQTVISASCCLANALNLKITVSGIEITGQVKSLQNLNVATIQGGLISNALPIFKLKNVIQRLRFFDVKR